MSCDTGPVNIRDTKQVCKEECSYKKWGENVLKCMQEVLNGS